MKIEKLEISIALCVQEKMNILLCGFKKWTVRSLKTVFLLDLDGSKGANLGTPMSLMSTDSAIFALGASINLTGTGSNEQPSEISARLLTESS